MWSYIEKLHEVQQKDNLNLANKVKAEHVLWQQHKMNVKLAVQALSSSVADAIDFLRDDLHLPQFSGSEKTTEFIRIVDKLFEFMNSRRPHAKGYISSL
ncbi:DNA transposase THAP9 [Holothuria leucospilota]|uniref:DNA transposase THAP9 n=1 Tax=Holothuria leucospilota TaxID=206669 RepID=A0A9Q1CQN1_HOLLE|nr:DNA transposase THAP9 [Holothuria leucospilota]